MVRPRAEDTLFSRKICCFLQRAMQAVRGHLEEAGASVAGEGLHWLAAGLQREGFL